MPGAFKLDHLQPVNPISFSQFYNFFTFILEANYYYPRATVDFVVGFVVVVVEAVVVDVVVVVVEVVVVDMELILVANTVLCEDVDMIFCLRKVSVFIILL